MGRNLASGDKPVGVWDGDVELLRSITPAQWAEIRRSYLIAVDEAMAKMDIALGRNRLPRGNAGITRGKRSGGAVFQSSGTILRDTIDPSELNYDNRWSR